MIKIEDIRCKSCEICIVTCPRDVLALSDRINALGYRVVEAVKPEECNACTLCALMCPEVAISVYREPHEAWASGEGSQ